MKKKFTTINVYVLIGRMAYKGNNNIYNTCVLNASPLKLWANVLEFESPIIKENR